MDWVTCFPRASTSYSRPEDSLSLLRDQTHFYVAPARSATLYCQHSSANDARLPCPYTCEGAQHAAFHMQRHYEQVHQKEVGKHTVDDRWDVPYNPYLLRKFNANINEELCASIKSVKYLYKYIFKGHDVASIQLRHANGTNDIGYDEISYFLKHDTLVLLKLHGDCSNTQCN